MKRYKGIGMILLLIISIFLAACSSQGTKTTNEIKASKEPTSDTVMNEPVTLTFFTASLTGSSLEIVEKLLKEKFPKTTFNIIVGDSKNDIPAVVAGGTIPDLISYNLGGITKLRDLQLLSDLTPLIKKYNFDLNRLADGIAENVKSYSATNSELLLMPVELNNIALFYNKNIFDKFNVPYPKDGLTWDQLYEVAKSTTRLDNGVQYKGFRFEEQNLLFKNQLGLAFVDPKTSKAVINTDSWKNWISVMMRFYEIPGNTMTTAVSEKDDFLKNQTLAMRVGPNILIETPAAVKNGLNFDLVSLPYFTGMEGKGSQLNAPYLAIPPTSKHKDQAFQVLAYLLSDEVQSVLSQQGKITVLKSEKVRQEFGKGDPAFKDKNLAAFFKDTIAKPAPSTDYDTTAKVTMVKSTLRAIGISNKDVNTALRETEEEINKAIEALKVK